MTFGERLGDLRKSKMKENGSRGWSQEDLARATGMPAGTIRSHEKNRRVPSVKHLYVYCKALGVSCEKFNDCSFGKDNDSIASSPFDAALVSCQSAKEPAQLANALADALRAAEEGSLPRGKYAKLVKNYRHATGEARKVAREKLMSAIAKEV